MYGVIACKYNGEYMTLGDGEYSLMQSMANELHEILKEEYGDDIIVKAVTLTPERYADIREDSRLAKKELSVYF